MNFLFYVGIIVPTVITIALFIIFIYCWLLQRARKEVLTKKYDPHGRMRSLGMSMNPPLPPTCCLLEDVLLSDVGEDNVAYDVSRSPSTQQDWRGRPMYHTYHDSGISAGLSPSQENEPRQSLVYRTCPDSGVSGLNLLQPGQTSYHVSRGWCHADDVLQRQPQLHQVYEDQVHIDTRQQQQYQRQSPHLVLHHSHAPASGQLNDGVCGSRNINHCTTSRHSYSPQTTIHLADYNQKHNSIQTPATATSSTPQQSTRSFHQEETEPENNIQNGQLSCRTDQGQMLTCPRDTETTALTIDGQLPLDKVIMMSPSVNTHLHQPLTPDSTGHLYDLPLPLSSSSPTTTTTTTSIPLKQSYRDSGVVDTGQPTIPGMDRPDSQASHSSTTDSEDSGFRSSYCAAHRKAVLSKQEHPLLKPLRKTKRHKNHNKSSRRTTCNSENSPAESHTLLITLSPKNLERNISNFSVIQQSLSGQEMVHRPVALRQARTNTTSSVVSDGNYCTATSQDGVGLGFCDNSPTNSHQHSPSRNIWAPQSTNDTEVSVKQTIHLTDISTHLSWKYLSDPPSCTTPETELLDGDRVLEHSHHDCPPGLARQAAGDRSLDMYGLARQVARDRSLDMYGPARQAAGDRSLDMYGPARQAAGDRPLDMCGPDRQTARDRPLDMYGYTVV